MRTRRRTRASRARDRAPGRRRREKSLASKDGADAMKDAGAVGMCQVIELARVEPHAFARWTLIDFHAVQFDRLQVHAALRTLHVVQVAQPLLLFSGHLRA